MPKQKLPNMVEGYRSLFHCVMFLKTGGKNLIFFLVMLIDPSTKGILFLQENRITKSAMNFNPDEDKIGRIFFKAIPTFSMATDCICSY